MGHIQVFAFPLICFADLIVFFCQIQVWDGEDDGSEVLSKNPEERFKFELNVVSILKMSA